MMNSVLEQKIIETICQSRNYQKSFEMIIGNMNDRFNLFNPNQDTISVEKYFGSGMGEKTAKKSLLKAGIIQSEWLRPYLTKEGKEKIDFRGLYIFLNNTVSFYVGISKGVIGRICQHVKGKSHYTSTLAFKIGLIIYEASNNEKFNGKRMQFDFNTYVEPAKNFLMKQKVSLFHIENIEELALFEIYCSMKLGTWLNDFETH